MVEATAYLRRSFVRRKLEAAGARFAEVAGAAVAASFANATDELATARVMGLADLSPLPRCGFKGAGTADWLAAQGYAVIVISSEMPEVLRVSDRIVAMHHGRIVREFTAAEVTEDSLIQAISGIAERVA